MTPYLLARPAARDFAAIAGYTSEQWGVAQARIYGEALIACMEAMAAGSPRNLHVRVRGRSILRHQCRRHVIFAIEQAGHLLVIAILHGRMNFEGRLADRIHGAGKSP